MTDADRDILFVAMTAYDEARGEGQIGIRAQIHSVINRHAVGKWYSRKTLAGTVFLGYAYSALNNTDPNREVGVETSLEDPIYQLCLTEAAMAIAGTSEDPSEGATHYYEQGTAQPSWVMGVNAAGAQVAPAAVFTAQVGKHLFYKGVQ